MDIPFTHHLQKIYMTVDAYLSGDVKTKLEQARIYKGRCNHSGNVDINAGSGTAKRYTI